MAMETSKLTFAGHRRVAPDEPVAVAKPAVVLERAFGGCTDEPNGDPDRVVAVRRRPAARTGEHPGRQPAALVRGLKDERMDRCFAKARLAHGDHASHVIAIGEDEPPRPDALLERPPLDS